MTFGFVLTASCLVGYALGRNVSVRRTSAPATSSVGGGSHRGRLIGGCVSVRLACFIDGNRVYDGGWELKRLPPQGVAVVETVMWSSMWA